MADTLLKPIAAPFANAFGSAVSQWAGQENNRQAQLTSRGNNLASQGSTNLANTDFNQLGLLNQSLAQQFNARQDTILTRRQMPGMAQTLLSNPVRSL